ncbi:MAG TPA: hypothetical protein VEJ18_05815, partial [Planctomycetota bacterium]|nr:hypothetical protein [Planctomycetota bacterium]
DREAEALLGEAAAREARRDWAAAEDLAAQALSAADRGSGAAGLRKRAEELRTTAGEARRRQHLLDRLDHVRLRSGGPPHEAVAGYTGAFAEAGLDFGASPEEIGRAVAARDPALREGLIQALDDCASRIPPHDERMQETWRRIVQAASAADADPWRRRLRTAILKSDQGAVRDMARSVDSEALPPQGFLLLGQALHNVCRDPDLESRVLAEGGRRHPGDYWIHFTTAHRCLPGRDPLPGGPERAERHARVAVALRPDNPDARAILGVALLARAERSADRDEILQDARRWLQSALETMPADGPKQAVRAVLLAAEGRLEEARLLLRTSDGRPPPPWVRGVPGLAPPDRRGAPPPDRR